MAKLPYHAYTKRQPYRICFRWWYMPFAILKVLRTSKIEVSHWYLWFWVVWRIAQLCWKLMRRPIQLELVFEKLSHV